uniref:Uncharacterized protein n=1 Tax=Glossina austeni TaxID=7395 RepID=A0A1A9VSI9_GLOAU
MQRRHVCGKAGPTPDNISNCGVLMAPADSMTSRLVRILYSLSSACISTPKCATMGTSIIKRSGPPASNNRIFHLGFSERRAAKVQPAVPAPTIMKSYSPSILMMLS